MTQDQDNNVALLTAETEAEKKEDRLTKRPESEKFKKFVDEIEKVDDPEQKIRATIAFMEDSLGKQTGTPYFRTFWDARDLCLQLFKKNINSQSREVFWERYKELSKEARLLKEMLDKQSAFALEQITLALKILEEEVQNFPRLLEGQPTLSDEFFPESLSPAKEYYQNAQKQLALFNTYAVRVNTMRRELIKTEMRVRYKNQLFQQLSKIGDHIFPERKKLIDEVSQRFTNDVQFFIENNVNNADERTPFFTLREEIKMLQSLAKELTINTQSFSATRSSLSKAWDTIKEALKEKKKEKNAQREISQKNREVFSTQLNEVIHQFADKQITFQQADKLFSDLSIELKTIDLDYPDLKDLREEIKQARKPVNEEIEAEQARLQQQRQEKEEQRKQEIEAIKIEIQEKAEQDPLDAETLLSFIEEVKEKAKSLIIHKQEQRSIDQALRPLHDLILHKKELALLNLSQDDQNALKHLKEVLEQRKDRRKEVKSRIDQLRREESSSGLDFEKAISLSEEVQAEKERLDAINGSIQEVEEKISQLQGKA